MKNIKKKQLMKDSTDDPDIQDTFKTHSARVGVIKLFKQPTPTPPAQVACSALH